MKGRVKKHIVGENYPLFNIVPLLLHGKFEDVLPSWVPRTLVRYESTKYRDEKEYHGVLVHDQGLHIGFFSNS